MNSIKRNTILLFVAVTTLLCLGALFPSYKVNSLIMTNTVTHATARIETNGIFYGDGSGLTGISGGSGIAVQSGKGNATIITNGTSVGTLTGSTGSFSGPLTANSQSVPGSAPVVVQDSSGLHLYSPDLSTTVPQLDLFLNSSTGAWLPTNKWPWYQFGQFIATNGAGFSNGAASFNPAFWGTGNGTIIASNNTATTNFNLRPNGQAAGSGITLNPVGVGIGTAAPGYPLTVMNGMAVSNTTTTAHWEYSNGTHTVSSTNASGVIPRSLILTNATAGTTNLPNLTPALTLVANNYTNNAAGGTVADQWDMFGTNVQANTPTSILNFGHTLNPGVGSMTFPMTLSSLGTVTLSTITAGGASMNAGGIVLNNSSYFNWVGRSLMYSPGDSIILFQNNTSTDFNRLQLGGTTAAFPAIGRTNGDLVVFGGDGLFTGGATNKLVVQGTIAANTNGITFRGTNNISAWSDLGQMGAHMFTDGTNMICVFQNAAGTRTTNKLSMTSWP